MKIYEIQNKGKGVITTLTPSNLLLLNPPVYFESSPTIGVTGYGNETIPYRLDALIDGSETKIQAGTNVTITGNGTTPTPYIINASGGSGGPAQGIQDTIITDPLIDTDAKVQIESGSSVTFGGVDGESLMTPYLKLNAGQDLESEDEIFVKIGIVEGDSANLERGLNISQYGIYLTEKDGKGIHDPFQTRESLALDSLVTKQYVDFNPQKTITSNYTISISDNNYTIFIDNGATPVNITIPMLGSNFSSDNLEIGFVQQGTGLVTFVASGTTLRTPTGLKIKGQNYQAYIQRVGLSEVWHVLGNVEA
jgi:hypothetical protein